MFSEEDLLPISALQHLLYCARQCALIHVEQLWAENRFTVEGRHLHERANGGKPDMRKGLRTVRALPLWSYSLGLIGKADVVEFGEVSGASGGGVGSTAFPVEYKRGKPKAHDADRVQLCAQGLCLEEMFGARVEAGALFYGRTRRRTDVAFDEGLRELTRETAGRLHELLRSGRTPAAVYEKKKCERCSLKNLCLPRMPAGRAERYLDGALTAALAAAGGPGSE
ncbi:MAG TPA: CRISPR-associated protein Cas4 [Planctomycetales bacterium]|nr:CRISPR-associated protein Cas4 [Planctomycetales bacterium]